jgi:hypothetical protein
LIKQVVIAGGNIEWISSDKRLLIVLTKFVNSIKP